MSQPSNIKEQMETAAALCRPIRDSMQHPGDPAEVATSCVMNALRRIVAVAVDDLPSVAEKMEAISYACAYMGEFIGISLRGMPPAVIDATMAHFAQEMSDAYGAPVLAARMCAAPASNPQKEPLH
ncbi:hypothetical protein ACFPIF_19535 [Brevundimonas faecalis]|uniref:hypothetical protein n=1 Tax=Brevundimonas faecalis TaxID=947378 RepID=UPI00361559D3